MNFEVIAGNRRSSELLYVVDQKMIYQKKSVYNNTIKYECRIKSCKARINVLPDGKCTLPKKYVDHNHGDEEEAYEELKALKKIKDDCENSVGALGGGNTSVSSIRDNFRRTVESNQEQTKNISFSKIKRGLQYIVSKSLVTSPKTAIQVIEAFNLENIWTTYGLTKDETNPKSFFTACIIEEKFSFCLFSSVKTINLIKENIIPAQRTYLMDATFKIVPQGCFKQLLVIYIEYFEEIFPMFFVLMDKKTFEAYNALLLYINENIFSMEPSIFITDFEQGMRKAVNLVFPQAKLLGCWFHFCQAVRRNMTKRKDLLEFIRSSKNASLFYHKVLALPLLPSDLIRGAFLDIRSQIALMDSQGLFTLFLKYFESHWMQKVGCKNFSVHNQTTRTTSAVEAYNGVLGRAVEKNGHFFKFVRVIRDEEFFKSRHFGMLCENGVSLTKRRKRSSVERSKIISENSRLLDQGNITVGTFLSRMVNEKNNVCVKMIPNIFREESTDEDMSDDEVDPTTTNDNDCVVCRDKAPNIVLLPCRHLKICDTCHLILQADTLAKGMENYNCPYCRETVQDSMQVYT